MDQELKQRVVGAVVITSLAAIFVPMLFDDPINQSGKRIGMLEIPLIPNRFSDLEQSKIPKSIDDVVNLPQPQVFKKIEEKTIAKPMQSWFIQLGIFESETNAIALQNKVRRQGFPVSIKRIKTEKGMFHKVLVGPELDKNRAEKMKAKIDRLNNMKSILSSLKY